MKSFQPVLFALNNDPNSEQPMIDFLVSKGLTYEGKQNYDAYGFSRDNVFTYENFKIVISWMRNLATIKYSPDGWNGAFTEVYFEDIREACTSYVDHNSLAFCYNGREKLKLAIPENI